MEKANRDIGTMNADGYPGGLRATSARRSCSIIAFLTAGIIPDLLRVSGADRGTPRRPRTPLTAGLLAAGLGTAAAWIYHLQGLTLSHYDARAHLVVARRIIDSITPGWQQIGAVWLPLPHLLNMLPVQNDWLYHNGASAVAFSVAGFVAAVYAITRILLRATGSPLAAWAGAAVFALNPNVLYLQSTPLEEPLLFGFVLLGVALLFDWLEERRPRQATAAGWLLAAACLTRYEAWPITAVVLLAAVWACWRRGQSLGQAIRDVAGVASRPTLAILAFFVLSRVTVGHWLVTSGFFVPQNIALGHPWTAAEQIAWGEHQVSGRLLLGAATAGAVLLGIQGAWSRERARSWVLLGLGACVSLPWYAFLKGHPFRIRYMIPLIPFEAVAVGTLVGAAGRFRRIAAFAMALFIIVDLHPFDPHAPMVLEAQWDRPNFAPRQHVTDCLRRAYDGRKILISMGALGHYMQDLGRAGFPIRDFVHEGNGIIWQAALQDPRPFVGWMLIEEKAQGGGPLAKRARAHPRFLEGFAPVCHGAGVVLYQRTAGRAPIPVRGRPTGGAP